MAKISPGFCKGKKCTQEMSEYVFLFYRQRQKNASDVILTQIKV